MFKLIFVFSLFITIQSALNETSVAWSTLSTIEYVELYNGTDNEPINALNNEDTIFESSDLTITFFDATSLEIETTDLPTTMNTLEETTMGELLTSSSDESSPKIKYSYFVIELLVQEDLRSQLNFKTPKEIYSDLTNRVEIFVQNALDSNGLFGFDEFSVLQMLRKDQNLLELTCYLTYRNTPTMNAKFRPANPLTIKNALVLGNTNIVDIDNGNIRVYKSKPGNKNYHYFIFIIIY